MHQAEIVMRAHLADEKSTEASIGALYALLIAARPQFEDEDWRRVHKAIRLRLGYSDGVKWINKLDKIKARGWRLHEACCELIVEAA